LNRKEYSDRSIHRGGEEERVVAVVVTHQPDVQVLTELCSRLAKQVTQILVIDNTEHPSGSSLFEMEKVQYIALGSNLGIGAAQNRGITRALDNGASHVLLMDQDSVPSLEMVATLLKAERELILGQPDGVAAVGPQAVGKENGAREPFIVRREHPFVDQRAHHIVPVRYLHSSGTLIRAEVFNHVGGMNETFFIDLVDMEWCFRAQSRHFFCYGVTDAMLYHDVGDKQRIGIGPLERVISRHPPSRLYYQVRNLLLLGRLDYVPKLWLLQHGARIAMRFLMLLLFCGEKSSRCHCFLTGLLHGFSERGGEYLCGAKRRHSSL